MGEKRHSRTGGGGSSTINKRYDYFESVSSPPDSRSFKKIELETLKTESTLSRAGTLISCHHNIGSPQRVRVLGGREGCGARPGILRVTTPHNNKT